MSKKRAYSEEYLKYGFTSIILKGVEKPQCVICMEVLSAESMKPFQLKHHFETKHRDLRDRDLSFFQRKAESAKRSRLDTSGSTYQISKAHVHASYLVSLRIANVQNHTPLVQT